MPITTRRDFLVITASAGISICTDIRGFASARKVQVGVAGWTPRSRYVASTLRNIPDVDLVAVAGVSAKELASTTEGKTVFTFSQPASYKDVQEMLEANDLDVVYADSPATEIAGCGVHLLLENDDPRLLACCSGPNQYIQLLPQHEFSGFNRWSRARGNWRSAAIDCRAALPDAPLETRAELAGWLYHQAGEAIDFACEMLQFQQPSLTSATAAHGASPDTANFVWSITDSRGNSKLDISVRGHARRLPSEVKIILQGERESTILHSQPRNARFVRLVSCNLLDAIRSSDRQRLCYPLTAFQRSNKIVSEAAASF